MNYFSQGYSASKGKSKSQRVILYRSKEEKKIGRKGGREGEREGGRNRGRQGKREGGRRGKREERPVFDFV